MKTGLILEGGAMRGMFTCGVTDVFMENGINFDGVIGVSAGAAFGCNVKSKQPGRAVRYNKRFAHDWRYSSLRSLFTTGDLYGAKFCYETIPYELDVFDFQTFKDNPTEFHIVATNAETGEPIYKKLELCDIHDMTWIRGSASLPIVAKPVKIDGYTLLDGGVTDSIPVKYFESIGFDRNVVILTQPRGFVKTLPSVMPLMKLVLKKYPNFLRAMAHRHIMYNEETQYVFDKADKGELIVICPETSLNMRRTEKNPDEMERVYQIGRRMGEKWLDRVREFIIKNE